MKTGQTKQIILPSETINDMVRAMASRPSIRVADYWSWLPVFRVVAETQHLPTAATSLNISASAISRSVKLLEESFGHELFDRRGRNIYLNKKGELLLSSVRDAMRTVDESYVAIRNEAYLRQLSIAANSALTRVVLIPVIDSVLANNPTLNVGCQTLRGQDTAERLLQGEFDIALSLIPYRHDQLGCELAGSLPSNLYCGKSHPLYAAEGPHSLSDLTDYEFVGPPRDKNGNAADGWPPHLKRKIRVTTDMMEMGLSYCKTGRYLAVLPKLIAEPEVATGSLKRINTEDIASFSLYIVYRHNPIAPAVKLFVDALRQHFRQTLATDLPEQVIAS